MVTPCAEGLSHVFGHVFELELIGCATNHFLPAHTHSACSAAAPPAHTAAVVAAASERPPGAAALALSLLALLRSRAQRQPKPVRTAVARTARLHGAGAWTELEASEGLNDSTVAATRLLYGAEDGVWW